MSVRHLKTVHPVRTGSVSPELLHRMDAYRQAASYLSVGKQRPGISPEKPLELSQLKPLAVGHWGTTPGQDFSYVHVNRVIKRVSWICSISPVQVTAVRRLPQAGPLPSSRSLRS